MRKSQIKTKDTPQILVIEVITIYKYNIDKNEELTPELAGKIIRSFQIKVQPHLKTSYGYYAGEGQAIMGRVQADTSRPNNRIVKNYCSTIVDNFQGYLTGTPITYAAKGNTDIEALQKILNANDVTNEDSEFLRQALIYGIAYELTYINENNQIRFKAISPESAIPVFSDDLDSALLYMITFSPIANWDETLPTAYRVSIYDSSRIYTYKATNDFNSFVLLDEQAHYFGEVPFSIFNLNADNASIFERIITLQDAYNSLLSDEVNDFEAFVDAYMVMRNITADAKDLAAMKASRTILIDGDSDVSYLTKNISDTQIENMLTNLNQSIHTISNSPDFSSEEFNSGVSSGIALQFKLVGFNNIASNIQARMGKALGKRIDFMNAILRLVDTDDMDIDISFTHNLPSSITDTVNAVNALRGLVSDETLLAQIPFIDDVQLELDKIAAQDERYMPSFSNHVEDDEDEEEAE